MIIRQHIFRVNDFTLHSERYPITSVTLELESVWHNAFGSADDHTTKHITISH
jgi:hypothetical protein